MQRSADLEESWKNPKNLEMIMELFNGINQIIGKNQIKSNNVINKMIGKDQIISMSIKNYQKITRILKESQESWNDSGINQ